MPHSGIRIARPALRASVLVATLLIPAALITSCKVGPDYHTPAAKIESNYASQPVNSENESHAAEIYWWKSFNDPVLDELIQVAFRNNPSLQAAGVRILQARAQLNQSIGNLFPQQQGLSGGINYTRLNTPSQSVVSTGFSSDYWADQALFSASWEIDFWGKYRRTIESDRAAYLGTIASYDDALVTLIADVATSYVNIRTTEERLRVADKNAATQRESLRVATAQFNQGETSELDMRQAATVLSQTLAGVPRLQNTLNQARNGLAVLLGETPEKIDGYLKGAGRIPSVSGAAAVGIPRDLLRRRPDVRQAGFNAASQSALIGVTRANMYPALSLSGAFGFAANNEGKNSLSDLFLWQNRAAQGGASLVWPIFNYGRLVNQVRVQDAAFQQAILNYQNTVLIAQQEVENGLSAFYTEQQALTNLTAAAAAAGRSTELSMIQYKAGEVDYTTVLSSEQVELSVEDSLATAQGNVVLNLISIYRALGGGWELREGNDVISSEVKSAMARRTNWGKMLDPARHLPPRIPEEKP